MGVWVFTGVAGSGKTSLAKATALALGWECLDADSYHPEANLQKMRSAQALDEADREPWLQGLAQALLERKGRDLILAFPGLKAAHRKRLEEAVGADAIHWAYLDVCLSTVEARLDGRGGFFPTSLATTQFNLWERDLQSYRFDGEASIDELVPLAVAWVRSWHH